LFGKGYSKEKVIEIFNFIDAIIKIQDEAKKEIFYEEIMKLKGGKPVAIIGDLGEYITKENRDKWMEKGMEKGKELGKLEVARKMLDDGFPLEAVVKYTGLMMENIKDLMKS
jgi:predicted transposase/invertase (TIGR01784 family)